MNPDDENQTPPEQNTGEEMPQAPEAPQEGGSDMPQAPEGPQVPPAPEGGEAPAGDGEDDEENAADPAVNDHDEDKNDGAKW